MTIKFLLRTVPADHSFYAMMATCSYRRVQQLPAGKRKGVAVEQVEEAETGTVRENMVGKASRKRAKTRKPTAAGLTFKNISGHRDFQCLLTQVVQICVICRSLRESLMPLTCEPRLHHYLALQST